MKFNAKKKKIQDEQSIKILNKDRISITPFFFFPQAQIWLSMELRMALCCLGQHTG